MSLHHLKTFQLKAILGKPKLMPNYCFFWTGSQDFAKIREDRARKGMDIREEMQKRREEMIRSGEKAERRREDLMEEQRRRMEELKEEMEGRKVALKNEVWMASNPRHEIKCTMI